MDVELHIVTEASDEVHWLLDSFWCFDMDWIHLCIEKKTKIKRLVYCRTYLSTY